MNMLSIVFYFMLNLLVYLIFWRGLRWSHKKNVLHMYFGIRNDCYTAKNKNNIILGHIDSPKFSFKKTDKPERVDSNGANVYTIYDLPILQPKHKLWLQTLHAVIHFRYIIFI